MRTIHVIGTRGIGGAERFFARLTGALAGAGHETRALIRDRNPLADLLDPAVETFEGGLRPRIDIGTVRRIRRMTREWEPRVVQTYIKRATRLTWLPRRSPTVHVARLGGYYPAFWFRHADLWVANARNVCDYLVRHGFPPARIHLIGNFVELPQPGRPDGRNATRRGLGVADDDWLLLALGRFVEKKGFPDLVRAVALLPQTVAGRRVRLVVAGDGPAMEAVRQAVAEAGLGERVVLPGWVRDPSGLLDAADVFVCPSRIEPLGNVVLEAWSHALPVVSTRAAGPAELVEEGRTGLLAGVEDPEDLARAIGGVLEGERAWREGLGANGLRLVETRYSVEEILRQYLELYEHATKRPGRWG